ncbi:hypothetical protein [Actinoalloteichus spitiensis]|uniref:hypothetical protein n=1 Tax=Actinoalloteichus spitiensis TaxID=252394 RepID=UPI001FDF24E1|nr:hypothetical protein [Actinoalloteichus spitiensis]
MPPRGSAPWPPPGTSLSWSGRRCWASSATTSGLRDAMIVVLVLLVLLVLLVRALLASPPASVRTMTTSGRLGRNADRVTSMSGGSPGAIEEW